MCFLSGSIIFEDNNSKLFNFLTYGLLDENEIGCDKKVERTNAHISFTHNEVYKNNRVNSAEKCSKSFLNLNKNFVNLTFNKKCSQNTCFKMQFVFDDKINFLCDQETKVKDLDKNNKSKKGVILYYRFDFNGKKYLFFKLEEHDMNNIHHLIKLLDLKRNDLYDKRRENEKYNDDLLKKDTEFYDNILIFFHFNRDDILKNINIYNDNLRTGCELFIFEELKEFFLSLSLDDIDII